MMPLEMLGIRTPRGSRIHLYNVEGERRETLCGRHIGVNPRLLGVGGVGPQVSADLSDCGGCARISVYND
jgi:hypothetical protein